MQLLAFLSSVFSLVLTLAFRPPPLASPPWQSACISSALLVSEVVNGSDLIMQPLCEHKSAHHPPHHHHKHTLLFFCSCRTQIRGSFLHTFTPGKSSVQPQSPSVDHRAEQGEDMGTHTHTHTSPLKVTLQTCASSSLPLLSDSIPSLCFNLFNNAIRQSVTPAPSGCTLVFDVVMGYKHSWDAELLWT